MAPYPYFLLLVFVLQVTQQFQFSALELPSEQLVRPLFDRWRLYHNKGYSSQEEEARRYEIFKKNLQMVLDHNANSLVSSYTLGLNQFQTSVVTSLKRKCPSVSMTLGSLSFANLQEKQGKVSLKEFESIEGTDKAIERNMLKAVRNQPLTAVIDGSKAEFKSYAGGIYKGPCAESGSLSVLVVGYGSENGDKYWIIKNSWGTEWGENGYMKLERNSNIFGGRCGFT
ncbi:probable cysteine protease RDL6 [Selaginella moellendorffii]|uniref:probable cysteine protease RDL6 n=1 Tax=Selaginella moellendorffii TaxID=88036 RepID=UPI000D1CE3B5|nr:probable cysteine protease RDL6 [Selaginella moellendorffii]|eukprot:XP_024541011.1 probable cysteine protease RDL6 [Selaginella moellendorffii]